MTKGKIDYYEKNLAFWKSVERKYPSNRNRAEISRNRNGLRKEMRNNG